ncbi:MAG: PEGA domain-containing protein [Myxococcota bacterium]
MSADTPDRPDDGQDVDVIPRAEETMYIQEVARRTPGTSPQAAGVEGASAEAELPMLGFTAARAPAAVHGSLVPSLRAAAAALAVLAVGFFFFPAFRDAVQRDEYQPARLPEPPPLPPPEPGDPVTVTVLVNSEPTGADVSVNGRKRGTTPTVFSLDCRVGEPIVAQFSLSGHATATQQATCPKANDGSLHIRAVLPPARGRGKKRKRRP